MAPMFTHAQTGQLRRIIKEYVAEFPNTRFFDIDLIVESSIDKFHASTMRLVGREAGLSGLSIEELNRVRQGDEVEPFDAHFPDALRGTIRRTDPIKVKTLNSIYWDRLCVLVGLPSRFQAA